jgi:outer membrane biogenesis lipoprotein LolB
MLKITSVTRGAFLVLLSCAFFLMGCSLQKSEQLSGVWQSEDALASKNLVLEFVPGGTGRVFSGSIIGFPTDADFNWKMKGDQITIETVGDEPIVQMMTILSQDDYSLSVEVNRTELTLVRIDEAIDDDAVDLLSTGIDN